MSLPGPPPALLLVDAAAQRVHDGVQVRADPQSEQGDVVTGVPDDGYLGVRGGLFQAAEKARGADAAREHGDAHTQQSVRSGRPRRRRGALTDRAAPDSFGDFFRISGTGATIITFSA